MEEPFYRIRQKSQGAVLENEKPQINLNANGSKVCPKCGAVNDLDALFCENCGFSLKERVCPSCGALIEEGMDLCERCKTYLAKDVCSFCGASMSSDDSFCPVCGSSRNGIVCPTCHSLSMFSFCPVCGTALTEMARKQLQAYKQEPQYKEILNLSQELEKLMYVNPVETPAQKEKAARNAELRARILTLLNEGYRRPEEQQIQGAELDGNSLADLIQLKRNQLQKLLDESGQDDAGSNPAQARNYAMARKPVGSSLGWKCNYKHAIHSGPFGCACPQMGGKWVVLDGNTEHKIVDD